MQLAGPMISITFLLFHVVTFTMECNFRHALRARDAQQQAQEQNERLELQATHARQAQEVAEWEAQMRQETAARLQLQLTQQEAEREQERATMMLDALTKFQCVYLISCFLLTFIPLAGSETLDHQLKNLFSGTYAHLDDCDDADLPPEARDSIRHAKVLVDTGAEICYNHQAQSS